MRRLMSLLIVAIAANACGEAEPPPNPPRDAAQQRAVDSTVGASALPGAQGVRGALAASDSAAARARVLDSLSKIP